MRHQKRESFDASSIVRAYEKITLEDAIKLAKVKSNLSNLQNKRLERIKSENRVAPSLPDKLSPSQKTVTPKDLQLKRVSILNGVSKQCSFQFMESGENIDSLYTLFSDLLDRKLHELNATSVQKKDISNEDDIQDDYMAEVVRSWTLWVAQLIFIVSLITGARVTH